MKMKGLVSHNLQWRCTIRKRVLYKQAQSGRFTNVKIRHSDSRRTSASEEYQIDVQEDISHRSEFERDLIIGVKIDQPLLLAKLIIRTLPSESVGMRWRARADNRVCSDQEDDEVRGSQNRVASVCKSHSEM
ncbi:hypothetical protein TNCT_728511 [Trichonephila clavata]|uniref:Uncharacterized protein n=1 Tax=Trichonephila clavata TaxID=2740835 RepID=A0A8X6FNC4_TRICU|nr:hypothetical protein TNCT_728511 [Trichonephila clavata]